MSFSAFSGERVILKDSKEMKVTLNTFSVRCSSLGYGMKELKVNIAELDGWTLFDHTNVRFGDSLDLPCMTAGTCSYRPNDGGFSVNDILQNNPRVEKVIVNREVIENRFIGESDSQVKVCFRVLAEHLKTQIAGIEFTHVRTGEAVEFPVKYCSF